MEDARTAVGLYLKFREDWEAWVQSKGKHSKTKGNIQRQMATTTTTLVRMLNQTSIRKFQRFPFRQKKKSPRLKLTTPVIQVLVVWTN